MAVRIPGPNEFGAIGSTQRSASGLPGSGGGAIASPAVAPFAPGATGRDDVERQLDMALGRAGRARAQSASALTFEQILAESADQAPEDGAGIFDTVNRRLDEHIRDALEVFTDADEREVMMDLLEHQAEPVRVRARDRQIEARTGFLRRQVAGVTDDWAAQARLHPNEAPAIAIRAAAAVHAVVDNDDARVISAHRVGDLVQATERKVLSAALGSLVEQNPDQVPGLLADPDSPYRKVLPEDHLEDARAEAELRVQARAAENLARLERAIDIGTAGPGDLKRAADEGWLDEDAEARMRGRLDKRTAEARADRERVLRVAGLVADGGTLDPGAAEDREAADVYYEHVVEPGLEALDPETRIGEAAGFAVRIGVLPKEARRRIRGGLAALVPAIRARAAEALVRLGEAAPELTRDFDPGLRTEAYLIASLVDSGVDAAHAVEMAGDALARNSAADMADRERRMTEENHGAENERFLAERWDGIEGGQTVPTSDHHAVFSGMVRARFLRTGDLAAARRIAFNDFWRERFPRYPERDPDGNPFDPGRNLPPDLIGRPGRPDAGDDGPRLLASDVNSGGQEGGNPLPDGEGSDSLNGGDGGRDDSGTGAPAEDEARPSLDEPSGEPTGPSDEIQIPSPPEPGSFEVPAWKKDMVGQDEMDRFMGHQGETESNMRNALGETFAAEGGFKTDRQTGQAFAGITAEVLEQIKKIEPRLKDVNDVNSMPDEQVAKAYRACFDDALKRYGGPGALEGFKDPKTAAAFADTLFRHGQNGGARIIKDATNDAIKGLSPEQRKSLGLKKLTGQNGPKDTLDAMRRMTDAGFGQAVREQIADWRLKAMQKELSKGDRNRIDHFRFPKP